MESLITSINASGWSLGLYQNPDHWYATLHSATEGFTQSGLGPTPSEAIHAALSRPARTYFQMSPLKADERIDLKALGLVKAREPITRRF
jgi:hypothetical protein